MESGFSPLRWGLGKRAGSASLPVQKKPGCRAPGICHISMEMCPDTPRDGYSPSEAEQLSGERSEHTASVTAPGNQILRGRRRSRRRRKRREEVKRENEKEKKKGGGEGGGKINVKQFSFQKIHRGTSGLGRG